MESLAPAGAKNGGGNWVGGFLIAVIVFIGLAGVWGLSQFGSRQVVFYETVPSPLSDDDALSYSKKALEQAVAGSSAFNAVSFNGGPSKVGRSQGDPDIGYVLWDDPKNSDVWTYGVNVHRFQDRIECDVSHAE